MSESMNRKQNEDRLNSGRRLHLREVSSEYDDYDGVGADLKAGRVRLGQDIEDLVRILRIRHEHLLAIEQGRFADLPAPVYAVGFVRTYAEHVGLNGEDAIRRFKEEAEGLPHHTRLAFPTPEEESRVPKGWLLAVAVVAAVLIYAGWYYAENKDRLNLAEVPTVPERLAEKTVPQQPLQTPAVTVQTMPSEAAPAATVSPEASIATEPATVPETDPAAEAAVVEPVSSGETATTVVDGSATEPQAIQETTAAAAPPETVNQAVEAEVAPAVVSSETTATPVVAAEQPVPAEVIKPVEEVAVATTPVVSAARSEEISTETVAPAATSVVSEPVTSAPAPTTSVVAEPVEVVPTPEPTPTPAVVAEVQQTPQVAAVVPTPEEPVEAASSVPAPVAPVVAAVEPEKTDIPIATPVEGRKTETFGSPANESRVEIHARVDVWVQVTSQSGETLLSRILRQGDSFYAPQNQASFLTTGNAGALQILVDGKMVQPVGPPGAVRRDVPLEPDQLINYGSGNTTSADN